MGGFTDWVENVADSKDRFDYRKKVAGNESASMWQSLSFGANYKAAYCLSACPAGEDVIGPYLEDRKEFLVDIVKPLQLKKETVYVVAGSDAEEIVAKRFKNKTTKRVSGGITPTTIGGFLFGLSLVFQKNQSKGMDAVYHFKFVGEETQDATITIRDKKLTVEKGLLGTADISVTADSRTWLKFLAKERSIIAALILRKIKVKGPISLFKDFAKCFPS